MLVGAKGDDGYTPIKGVDYFDGKDGEPGVPGDPFDVDKQGLLSELNDECGSHPVGFSFLATDTGNLYFQTSEFGIQPCTWSDPIPFGRGDNGA